MKVFKIIKNKINYYFRVFLITSKNFSRNQGFLISSGLTLKTIFAFIPGLLFIVGIVKLIVPFYKYKDNFLTILKNYMISDTYDVITGWINQLLETNKTISFISAAVFIFLSIDLFITLDNQIERIWSLKIKKSKMDKILKYWALFSATPFVLGGYFYYSGLIKSLIDYSPIAFSTSLNEILYMTGSVSLMGLFIFLINYIIPNTKVNLVKALIVSIVTTFIWFVLKILLTYFIPILIGRWSIIYGYFAVIVFFIFWTSTNWSVLLFGVEFLSVWQNKFFEENINNKYMYFIDIAFLILIIKDFYEDFLNKGNGYTIQDFSNKYKCNINDINEIIIQLEKINIITGDNNRVQNFFLKKDINLIRLSLIEKIVFDRIKDYNNETLSDLQKICGKIKNYYLPKKSSKDISIKNII